MLLLNIRGRCGRAPPPAHEASRYLRQPLVVEGDADGEAVVEEDQPQSQHRLPHKGHVKGPPPHPGKLQIPCSGSVGAGSSPEDGHGKRQPSRATTFNKVSWLEESSLPP